ncbi:flagellar motor protein MotA [Roseomonas sp. HJA6]|uniref:Flagellar motor protein MotA n=1 Tax=Roseomonas alba TaxID=2846776 RepID=A0ABS7AFI3_9PROT|nr:flagellar motor protein MotA [Neoroseomonas alba]MBW6399919.1 flagellar motor protein MotA [Neoroseomonas alba]
MTQPVVYLWRMLGFLLCVVLVTALLYSQLRHAFEANPVLNAVIVAVLLFGVVWNLRQVLSLRVEVTWLEGFRSVRGAEERVQPRLLAPMASMLSARRSERVSLSAIAMRSVMDGIVSRLDETRELSRYMTGLLIFLGLLGTFWGLLLTIASVADVIGNMSVGSGDLNQMFNQLKTGLARPLEGMGTAFSSSMLGLAGALVLGFMDLTAGQAQTRFTNELEEWLAGLTRLSSGVLGQEGEGGIPAYVNALLEQTAENLEGLQTILQRGEEGRAQTSQAMMTMTERLTVLTEQMRANNQVMVRVAEGQSTIANALAKIADTREGNATEEATRGHIRNIEILLSRLNEEVAQGRNQATSEIRNEIKILTRTIAAIAEEPPR